MALLKAAERHPIAELKTPEVRQLEQKHPQLAGRPAALTWAGDSTEAVHQMRLVIESMLAQREQMSRLIESMVPQGEIPGKAVVLQARRNVRARGQLLEEFGALRSTEVAELAGSKAANRAALANRWLKEGRIFAVEHNGRSYFPGFQFDADGQPLEVVAELLKIFELGGGWETALWFTAANGWLGGQRPVDLLESAPERVLEAARRGIEERVF